MTTFVVRNLLDAATGVHVRGFIVGAFAVLSPRDADASRLEDDARGWRPKYSMMQNGLAHMLQRAA